METTPDDSVKLQRERDLYRNLLELGGKDEIGPFLEDALSLLVQISQAQRIYLEIFDDRGEAQPPRLWMAHGCYDEDVAEIRAVVSRGVVAAAIATGQTIVTASALEDPRFAARRSIQRNRTGAVLCAPIGHPPLGIVYLQDRVAEGPFSELDRQLVERVARYLAIFADRLLLRRRHEGADATLPFRKVLRLEGVIGRGAAMAKVFQEASFAAPRDITVLLTGASGTGKTQIARVIHNSSPRAQRPFVELNCAALPETLLENELFGAAPGGHASALKKVEGKISAAEGGTLFLDEVGELHPMAQAKLLQFLQSKEYYPLGSAKAQRADVRIIAATNTDLKAAVARKAFREDLLYRLEILPIRLPSLAERREDIPELAEYFCARICEREKVPKLRLSAVALQAALMAEWPGNVRELAARLETAVLRALSGGASQLERRHLFPEGSHETGTPDRLTFQEATRQFQSQLLRRTLGETNWNITETSQRLELSRSHVHNLITAFGLERQR